MTGASWPQPFKAIYRFCGSLKLAVVVILSLAITLAGATVYESIVGTKAVQAAVYRTPWFTLILIALGTNIFCSAAQRFPWKRRLAGFLAAHLGILLVLFGSFLTRQYGIDGNLPLAEKETGMHITVDEPQLEIWDWGSRTWLLKTAVNPGRLKAGHVALDIKGQPSGLRLIVDEALPEAAAETRFVASLDLTAAPALEVEIFSDATGIRSSQWLRANDPELGSLTMGLATVSFAAGSAASGAKGGHPSAHASGVAKNGPHANPNSLGFLATPNGELRYRLSSRNLGVRNGTASVGESVTTGWRDFHFRVKSFISHAQPESIYRAAAALAPGQEGVPALSIHAETANQKTLSRWLGYGDTVSLDLTDRQLLVRFGPRLIPLPFAVKLDHFEVGHYPGTARAMTYSSQVKVIVGGSTDNESQHHITMNEPLSRAGYTFYQASYQETPQGVISVLSVGKDPGRTTKYLGSIFLVLGIMFMYVDKQRPFVGAPGATSKRDSS